MIWEDRTVKKTFLRFVSTALAAIMLFGCMNVGVFAADIAGEQNSVTVQTPSVTQEESVNASSAKAITKNKTIASILAGSKVEFTAAEKAVLNAVALKSETFTYTEPGFDAGESNVTLTLTDVDNTYDVEAKAIESGLTNKWMPVGGRAICAGGDVAFELTNGIGSFVAADIDHVEIDYELVIGEISVDTANFVANLPHTLATEAVAQKEVLDFYSRDGIYNRLSDFATYMGVLDILKDSFGAEAQAAIKTLVEKCIHKTGDGDKLYFAEYIGEYRSTGLAYYYAEGNYENLKEQLETVRDSVNTICADPKYEEIFTKMDALMPSMGLLEKKGAIEEVKTALNEKTLVPVNANIDRTSAYLTALANAVEAAIGNTSAKTVDAVTVATSVNVIAPDKTTLNITVQVVNKDGLVIDSVETTLTYDIDIVLSADDAQDLLDMLADMEDSLGIDTDNYVCEIEGDKLPGEGDTITSKLNITYTWAPVSYTIVVGGTEQILYADGSGLTIVLPGSGTADERYIYVIGGEEIPVGVEDKNYTFADVATLNDLCTDGKLVISRSVINAVREDIIAFVDAMNKAMASKASVNVGGYKVPVISFIPVEDAEGNISIIFRVTPYLQGVDYQALVMDVVKVLTVDGNPYDYIGINGAPLYDGRIYLQTVIDTVLSDNFGFDAICGMIDANGNIADVQTTEAALANVTVIETNYAIALADKLGGKLIAATVQADEHSFPLYITFEDYDQMASTLIDVEEALSLVKNYVNVNCENGVLGIDFTMPASLSAYYYAELLAFGQADLGAIENMEFGEVLNFITSLIKPLVANPDLTLDTIENTLAKAGQSANLSQYVTEAQFATIRKAINFLFTKGELESEASGTNYNATVSYEIRDILVNRFNIDDMFLSLIAEATEDSKGISLSFSVTDNTVEKHNFDALVFDRTAGGLQMLAATKDLASVLETAGADSIIVLLKDVTLSKDVVIKNRMFINLNGYTINGNMTASGSVRITNSNLAACGGVNGTVSGNFVITGGQYTTDVTSMLKQGYEVKNGCVENAIYRVYEDAEGNITIALAPTFMNLDNAPTTMDALKDFAVDVAFDLALNMFTNASLTVDGNNVYRVELNNLMGYLGGSLKDAATDVAKDLIEVVDFEGISAIANLILEDLTDFEAIAEAVNTGSDVAFYEIKTQGWALETAIAGGADKYITLNILPSEEVKTACLNIVIDPEAAEEDKAALAAFCDALAKSVTFNEFSVTLAGVGYTNGQLTADLTGVIDVEVDFSHDARYSMLIAAAVAYASKGDREATVSAINALINEGDVETLVAVIDNFTVAQLISAAKVFASTTCAEMLAELGIESTEMVELEALYADLLDIAGKVIARLGVTGNASTLGARKLAGSMATYVFDRENVKGFDVAISITLLDDETSVKPQLTHFEINADGNKVLAALVQTGYIYIDAHFNGVTVSDFTDMITATVKYAENVDVVVSGKGANDLVCTGNQLLVKINDGTETLTRFVIIVLGDTNGNGKADAGDAVKMAKHYVAAEILDGFAQSAADINRNNGVDAGDAVKVTGKYIYWNNYTSALN